MVTAYAVAFAAFGQVRRVEIIDAAVVGTLSSILIILIRTRRDVRSAIVVAVGSSVGVFFGSIIAFGRIRIVHGLYQDGIVADAILNWSLMAVGAIIGGLVASRANRR